MFTSTQLQAGKVIIVDVDGLRQALSQFDTYDHVITIHVTAHALRDEDLLAHIRGIAGLDNTVIVAVYGKDIPKDIPVNAMSMADTVSADGEILKRRT